MSEPIPSDPVGASAGIEDKAIEAALPHVEAPAISPVAAIEVPEVVVAATEQVAHAPSSTERFRASAAAHIAAARARLAQRKVSPVVVVALIAGLAGAIGTALATTGIAYLAAPDDRSAVQARALDESIARIESELAALKGNVERAARLGATHSGKTNERLDRIEKAQAEPAAKLAKLTESVEKLRTANAAPPPVPAPVQQAAAPAVDKRDVTGSIAPVPVPVAKPQPAGPAIVEGWTLRDVDRDGALIEGKRGLFEVVVGETIPGVGRVEGFRKQDGRWVVVTSKGLIVTR